MKRKLNIISFVISLFTLIYLFTGCDSLIDSLLTTSYPEEELCVDSTIDSTYYLYSNKVLVHIAHNEDMCKDSLSLRTVNEQDWKAYAFDVLVDDFIKVAWKDFILFIQTHDKYYTFDIKSYEVPDQSTLPRNKKGEIQYKKIVPEYSLTEYDIQSFKEIYSDYKEYEWYSY